MPFPWLFFIIFNNALLLGLIAYFYGQRHVRGTRAAEVSDDTRKALSSLHQLTSEVTHRVERQVAHLDRVVTKLAAKASDVLSADDGTDDSPRQILHDLKDLAAYLAESTTRFHQFSAQIGGGATAPKAERGTVRETESVRNGVLHAQHTTFTDPRVTEVRALADQIQASQAQFARERRAHRRDTTALPVKVIPLDGSMLPVGQEFEGVAREISTGGMSFSHAMPVEAPFVAVVMTPPDMSEICVVVESRHSRRIGPFYVTGGDFVCRLHDTPGLQMMRDQNGRRLQEVT